MGTPLRLLMIEDSEDDAALLLRELGRGGYEVAHQRVDTATAMLARRGKSEMGPGDLRPFHAALHRGRCVCSLLRAKGSRIPFIFVSGTIGEETAVSALKDGAQDYLMKTNLKRLVPAVQRELREAEQRQERERLERQVQQLHKFEAIGRLAGGIAHDFNNVIGAILGWAELCSQDTQPGTQLHERIHKIMDQADRAAGIDLPVALVCAAAISSTETNRPEHARSAKHESPSKSDRRTHHHYRRDRSRSSCDSGGPVQVDQVLMNLCLNARDAMPNGGRLLIETRNIEIMEEYCRTVTYAVPGSYVLLLVSDNGIGMDAETTEQIFEPFFTTKEPGKGTGLGLATVYGIVKQHGGFLNVDSEPGKGTIIPDLPSGQHRHSRGARGAKRREAAEGQ